MAKKIINEDKITDKTLHELLLMMDARLKHIEDMSADNRAIIIKLVKQNNSIVSYLKQLEVDIVEEYENELVSDLSEEEKKRMKKAQSMLGDGWTLSI